jgi:3-deoxy-7-phosphoheptulonate synthase
MRIVLASDASDAQVTEVERRVRGLGYLPRIVRSPAGLAVAALGEDRGQERLRSLETLPGVAQVTPFSQPFKLASRELCDADTVVEVGGVAIGGSRVVAMAGPCTVESREQLLEVALAVKAAGARLLRGGAFKPRSSPYAFQGLEEEGLALLEEARRLTGLPVVTEVMEPGKVEAVAKVADMLQIGARNAQNFPLLRAVGATGKPVLLKRGISTSIQEWLLAAEYVLASGSRDVVLCERGIRTFETSTRFTLDLNAVPVLKRLTHLPVVVDPSHGTGHAQYVEAMALAALAAGADGLLIEVHGHPERALCDGAQALKPDQFAELAQRAKRVAEALDRTL